MLNSIIRSEYTVMPTVYVYYKHGQIFVYPNIDKDKQ